MLSSILRKKKRLPRVFVHASLFTPIAVFLFRLFTLHRPCRPTLHCSFNSPSLTLSLFCWLSKPVKSDNCAAAEFLYPFPLFCFHSFIPIQIFFFFFSFAFFLWLRKTGRVAFFSLRASYCGRRLFFFSVSLHSSPPASAVGTAARQICFFACVNQFALFFTYEKKKIKRSVLQQ